MNKLFQSVALLTSLSSISIQGLKGAADEEDGGGAGKAAGGAGGGRLSHIPPPSYDSLFNKLALFQAISNAARDISIKREIMAFHIERGIDNLLIRHELREYISKKSLAERLRAETSWESILRIYLSSPEFSGIERDRKRLPIEKLRATYLNDPGGLASAGTSPSALSTRTALSALEEERSKRLSRPRATRMDIDFDDTPTLGGAGTPLGDSMAGVMPPPLELTPAHRGMLGLRGKLSATPTAIPATEGGAGAGVDGAGAAAAPLLTDYTCPIPLSRKGREVLISKNKRGKLQLMPEDLAAALKDHIVGQDDAIDTLAATIYRHYSLLALYGKDGHFVKSNFIIAGPTGSGKTATFEALEDLLDVPVLITDASSVVPEPYKGTTTNDWFKSLLGKCGGKIDKLQSALIILDEGDKIVGPFSSSDPRGERGTNLQKTLLKLVEGTTLTLSLGGGSSVTIDTRHILWGIMGAFSGLEGLEEGAVTQKNLQEYGYIPELLGRFPDTIVFKPTSIELLGRALKTSPSSPLHQMLKLLNSDSYGHIVLNLDEGAYEEIARAASLLCTGARSTNTIVNAITMDYLKAPSKYAGQTIALGAKEIKAILKSKKVFEEAKKRRGGWEDLPEEVKAMYI